LVDEFWMHGEQVRKFGGQSAFFHRVNQKTSTTVQQSRQNQTQIVTQYHFELPFKKALYFMLHTVPYRGLMKCNQVPNEDLKILICASII